MAATHALPHLDAIVARLLSKLGPIPNNSVSARPEVRQYPPALRGHFTPRWGCWSGDDCKTVQTLAGRGHGDCGVRWGDPCADRAERAAGPGASASLHPAGESADHPR